MDPEDSEGGTMATLTLKNVPEALVERLKREAKQSRRSLNQEALVRLEESLAIRRPTSEEKIAIMQAARARLAHLAPFTDEFLDFAKRDGRL